MQAETAEEKIKLARIHGTGKRFFRCSGRIMNVKSRLYGKPCNKILAEANSQGLIHAKIKCPHCGHMNEV